MVQNPPPKLSANQWLLTWPKDVIYEQNGNFLGFIMPLAFDKSVELFQLTNIKTSSKLSSEWNKFDRSSGEGVKRRLMLNANIAIAVHHLHASNKYVIVDMKPQNFLVSPEGKVTVLDIDTVQISNNGSVMYPSKAMTAEYLPPESKNLSKNTKIQIDWDRFILGIIFYEVLFGVHPFAGTVFKPPYDNFATLQDKISNGLFPFGSLSSYVKDINAKGHLFLQKLPVSIQNLFVDTFDKGLHKPNNRPSAEIWGQTIYTVIQQGEAISSQPSQIADKQREIDWQNCNKNSIQSLLEFRKKYQNKGKYTQKALQLINDLQTKNNQSTSTTTFTTKPTTQTQTTNTTYSSTDLKKRVNNSLTMSLLFLVIPNLIFTLTFSMRDGFRYFGEILFASYLITTIPTILAIIFSGVSKNRYNNYDYSRINTPLKTAKVFRWITMIAVFIAIIIVMIN